MSARRFRFGDQELAFEARRQGATLRLESEEGTAREWSVRRVGNAEFVVRDPDDPTTAHTVYAIRDAEAWWIHLDGAAWRLSSVIERRSSAAPGGLAAPIPAKVTEVLVRDGEAVTSGQVVLVLSAMKMQIEIKAPWEGIVRGLAAEVGDNVDGGRPLLSVEPVGGDADQGAASSDT